MTREQKIAKCKEAIAYYQSQYDRILAKHGTGVRPSYVSTDLAYEQMNINKHKQELAELENEQ